MDGERESAQLGEIWILGLCQIAELLSKRSDLLPLLLCGLPVAVEKSLPFDQLSVGQLQVVGRHFEATIATRDACSFGSMEVFDYGRL